MFIGLGLTIPDVLLMLALVGFSVWKHGWLRTILSLCAVVWGVFAFQYDVRIAASILTASVFLFIMGILDIIRGQAKEE